METTTDTIETLNELLAVNNDRIRAYENAIEETPDNNFALRSMFNDMILQSKEQRIKLAELVEALGGEFETGTTGAGKLYRAWTDVKDAITGIDLYTILSNCENTEDMSQKAYLRALNTAGIPDYIRTILTEQQQRLKLSHDKIKLTRDANK